METSLKIARIWGIDVELHITFLILMLAVGLLDITLLLYLIILFLSVLFHELLHCFAAKKYGGRISKIILLPIGGMAVATRMDFTPEQEIIVASIGPLFNLTLSSLLSLLNVLFPSEIIGVTVEINLVLGLFNLLIPAFPMDGGRIIRALLAMRMSFLKATELAKRISQVTTFVMFLYGFLFLLVGQWVNGWLLIIISTFIYLGAGAEYEQVVLKELIEDVKVHELLEPSLVLAPADVSVLEALEQMLAFKSDHLILLSKPLRVLSFWDINELKGKARKFAKLLPVVQKDESLVRAVEEMEATGADVVLVLHGRMPLGVVKRDRIVTFLKLRRLFRGV